MKKYEGSGNYNAIAGITKAIAVVNIICGIIAGIVIGNIVRYEYDFNVALMIGIWIGSFMYGWLFIIAAQIVEILHRKMLYLRDCSEKLDALNIEKND